MPVNKRPTLTTRQKLEIMARYCRCPGIPEKGIECGKHLPDLASCEFDHVHARALGGEDAIENFRPLCPDCHKAKTFGRGGEKRITTAGSDIGNIAKTRRLTKKQQEFRSRLMAKSADDTPEDPPKRKSKWPSRPFNRNQNKERDR